MRGNVITRHSRLKKGTLNLIVQLRRVKLVLVENEHAAVTTKREVRSAILDKNLAEENTTGRPHVDTIATSGIHIALSVDLDTIRNTNTGHSKDTAVSQEWLAVRGSHIKGITGQISTDTSPQ